MVTDTNTSLCFSCLNDAVFFLEDFFLIWRIFLTYLLFIIIIIYYYHYFIITSGQRPSLSSIELITELL